MSGSENLPEYKKKFLEQMQELRQQQIRQQQAQNQQSYLNANQHRQSKPLENNIINTSQYSGPNWRQLLNQTSYKNNHNDSHYELNLLINPQVKKKQNNIQLTPISQYSNAMHNKTVFVNPKSTSC